MSFKNLLVSGVKSMVEQQLSSKGSSSSPQQPSNSNSNMSYGGGGGYPPQGGYGGGYQQGGYPSQQGGYAPPQGGYQPQGGYPPAPAEHQYSMPGQSPYPGGNPSYPGSQPAYPSSQPAYPSSQPPYPGGASQQPGQIGFNIGGGASPYPPSSGPGYPSGGFPSGQAGYPSGPSSTYPSNPTPAYPSVPSQPAFNSAPGYPGGNPALGSGYAAPSGGGYASYGQQQQQQSFGHAPGMWGNPSVKPYPAFNANADAETLRKAMKGFGCNNNKVVQVLCARTNGQRQEIARAFKTMYGKDLLADLKAELHGDFEDVILALMERPAVYDAGQLRKAMAGIGTKESVLIEIMTTRTNAQIGEIRMVYKQMYGRDLEHDLIGETSGHFKRLLVSLCAGGRDESGHVDPVRANHDARKLYQAGEGRLGTDESSFNAILAAQNYAQLRLVFDEYHKMRGHSIEQAVDTEFSGDIRDGLRAICAVVRSKPAYFAQLLHNSMKGFGTHDNDLIRVVVTRAEVDMADIRNEFQRLFKTTLEAMIAGDCSGAYKDALIALVRGN